jgi:hypothetical protein
MRRIKIMFVLLLPLLWVAASAYSSVDVPSGGASNGCRTSISAAAAGHAHRGPAKDVYSSKQLARSLNRRAGMPSGSDGVSSPVIVFDARLSGLEQSPLLFSVVEAPADLARCWQFYWRTVAEPRAPSTVS